MPTVFFTDGSGPCYHTPQDETEIVDVDKLVRQADIGVRLVRDLASGAKPVLEPLPDDAEPFGEWVGATSELLGQLGPGLGLGLRAPYPRIPPPTFDDAAEVLDIFVTANGDPTLAPGSQWAISLYGLQLWGINLRGPSLYDPMVQGKTVALAALAFMRPMENGTCDGFLT